MIISIIAAMSRNQVIGQNNQLPWHLPVDLAHFKKTTLGKTVIMGYKTFESIGCRPLPKRRNIIISRQKRELNGAECFSNLEAALATCSAEAEVMICGGAEIYRMALPIAHQMYLTIVDVDIAGDTYFPDWNHSEWKVIARSAHPADAENQFACEFLKLTKENFLYDDKK